MIERDCNLDDPTQKIKQNLFFIGGALDGEFRKLAIHRRQKILEMPVIAINPIKWDEPIDSCNVSTIKSHVYHLHEQEYWVNSSPRACHILAIHESIDLPKAMSMLLKAYIHSKSS
ncbi:hypothetical protein D0812_21985 [Vibrio owensii]|uniref:Uncharacterized protein n=1 Tax=Vibrio owensii TaxID=696485 RepID=A0AAP9KC02_9VIBR|nr:hypothetical protein [Vibrio owensii]AYO17061.1 hypothetical protein D0812_21985 [Vibrio owensii]QGH49209.1 hypothetical protein APZ19_19005 [Vibrio owensii]